MLTMCSVLKVETHDHEEDPAENEEKICQWNPKYEYKFYDNE